MPIDPPLRPLTDQRMWNEWARKTTVTVGDGDITTAKLAPKAVTTAKIDDSAVTATQIAANAVETAKIIDDAVTYPKIQNVAAGRLLGNSTGSTGNVEEISVTSPLSLTAGALSVSFTSLNLDSGTYAPTLTAVTNVTGVTQYGNFQYLRVGSTVTVSGKIGIDPTAAGNTVMAISLPIASAFANEQECAGTAFAPAIAGMGAAILADVANDRAQLQYIAVDVTNQPMFLSFTYQVI